LLDTPPLESEKLSWCYVGMGVVVIYSTIPLARALRDAVDASVGRDLFLYLVAALVLVGAVYAFRNLRRRALPPRAYLWLGLVLMLFGITIYRLREIPEEAMHVAEYGLLGLLVFRALTHDLRDYAIYPAGALIVGIIGTVDEFIQWALPSRYFDLRDILINFVAGCLAQVAIFAGLRPRLISGFPARRSYGRLCYLLAAALALLGAGLQNTPDRVARYAVQHPALLFLLDGQSMMAEYGYLYDDPATGRFRSRFDRERLARLDLERGAEVAGILDRYVRGEGYRPFLAHHSVIRDPYAHEAGVHLYRREYYIDRAREGKEPVGWHYLIAYRENQILKDFFPRAIDLSLHRWDAATAMEVSDGADKSLAYESAVSASIITRMSVWQVLWLFVASIAVLLLAGRRLTRNAPNGGET
jgi:hypothetical protein